MRQIDAGSPETLGIIGDPVSHSLSPVMHNAALRALALPDVYGRWYTPAAQLAERVKRLRESGMRGANVTLPHKVAVATLLDRIDGTASELQAVNTIVREADGTLVGHNTDAPALYDSLVAFGWKRGAAIVLGAGGAARAALYALRQLGCPTITVVNRTLARGTALVSGPNEQAITPDDPALLETVTQARLIINATALGWKATDPSPLDERLVHRNLLVYDMVYRQTALLHAAAQCGAQTCDGLDMLVRQAGLAFSLWFGCSAPLETMRVAALEAMEAA